jgi:hypothetical protein
MATEESSTWQSYEEVARYLLEKMADQLGLGLQLVEGKQKLAGRSGTKWEVDAKGVKTEDGEIVIVECRRKPTSKLNQRAVGAFAYTIHDVGAAGGIIVTPIGLQKGGGIVGKYEGIHVIRLDESSTTTDYVLEFLNKVHIGASAKPLTITATITGDGVVTKGPAPESNT